MTKKTIPLSSLEVIGIMAGEQFVFLLVTMSLGLLEMLQQAVANTGATLIASGLDLLQFLWCCLCLYSIFRGIFIAGAALTRGEGRFDARELPPNKVLWGGFLWGIFCCVVSVQLMLRKKQVTR